jgi:hypothetical protein
MVLGLAPPFVFGLWHRRAPAAFYLSFTCGLVIGVIVAVNAWPAPLEIGTGASRALLGANLYGLIGCCTAYGIGLLATSNAKMAAPTENDHFPGSA